jgi:hypothetical protein
MGSAYLGYALEGPLQYRLMFGTPFPRTRTFEFAKRKPTGRFLAERFFRRDRFSVRRTRIP